MLKVGDTAPEFSGKDQNGKKVSLTDFEGKKVALYFYPKDDTPGCTKQACSLRDGYSELLKNDIQVIGVSADDAESHQKFIEKYDLPFPLIADTEMETINKYGVYGEKNLYGKKYMGIKRITFLINEDRKLTKIFKRVKTAEHSDEILKAFSS